MHHTLDANNTRESYGFTKTPHPKKTRIVLELSNFPCSEQMTKTVKQMFSELFIIIMEYTKNRRFMLFDVIFE